MTDMVLGIFGVLCAIAIVLYATWLLVFRLRAGYGPRQSFWQWLKHMFEAAWGL